MMILQDSTEAATRIVERQSQYTFTTEADQSFDFNSFVAFHSSTSDM